MDTSEKSFEKTRPYNVLIGFIIRIICFILTLTLPDPWNVLGFLAYVGFGGANFLLKSIKELGKTKFSGLDDYRWSAFLIILGATLIHFDRLGVIIIGWFLILSGLTNKPKRH